MMTRIPQKAPAASKGSLHDIQVLANKFPHVFERQMDGHKIQWISPLRKDDYAEYRDRAFFEKIGLGGCLRFPLNDFWPSGGPQWDGLAKDLTTGEILLIEAKAHISEVFGSGTQASEKSRRLIEATLRKTARKMSAHFTEGAWLGALYQTANRLAFLDYINQRLGTPARLVYLIFLNDTSVLKAPESISDWQSAFSVVNKAMELPSRHCLSDKISTVYVDVCELK